MKRIVCLGGGPAGLYSAILFKKALPDATVEVIERNQPDDTFGWGVVFSDKTMQGFRAADEATEQGVTEMLKNALFGGVNAAVVTAYNADLSIDIDRMAALFQGINQLVRIDSDAIKSGRIRRNKTNA